MANRYWVGGAGTWDRSSTSNWAAASGGASGASCPVVTDDVFFDSNSSSVPFELTIPSFNGPICHDVSFLSTNMISIQGTVGYYMAVNGKFIFNSNINFHPLTGTNVQLSVTLTGSETRVMDFSGNTTINYLQIWVNGTLSLSGDMPTPGLSYLVNSTGGTINTNGYVLRADNLNISSGTFNPGTSTCYLTSTFQMQSGTTGDCSLATFVMGALVGNAYYGSFNTAPAGRVYGTVRYIGSGSIYPGTLSSTSCTIGTLELASGVPGLQLASGTTTTVGQFIARGTPAIPVAITSWSAGSSFTLSKAVGGVVCDYLSIKDCAVTGGAVWYAGSHSTNVSNTSGWIFTDVPFKSSFLPFF